MTCYNDHGISIENNLNKFKNKLKLIESPLNIKIKIKIIFNSLKTNFLGYLGFKIPKL